MYILNLIMEKIKLRCFCYVEPKDASETSKIEINCGKLFVSKC